MTYKIKPEYLDGWGADATEDTVVTQEDLEMIARGWEKEPRDLLEQLIPQGDARISIDNGHTWTDPEDVIKRLDDPECVITWATIVGGMDDDAREQAASEMAPCTKKDFLARYLELAPFDLVIG